MKRIIVGTAAALAFLLGVLGGPAAGHVLVVDPPGNTETKTNWVGGGPLPDNAGGKGLIPGGPTGAYLQPASHGAGLNTACEAVRSQGRAAADIFGPPGPGGCPHGTF